MNDDEPAIWVSSRKINTAIRADTNYLDGQL